MENVESAASPIKTASGDIEIIRLFFDGVNNTLTFSVSSWVLIILTGFLILSYLFIRKFRRFRIIKLNISLGSIGKAEIRPNIEDIQIAHKIWTELNTRKAALPFEPDNDVIVEIYDSWYSLFTKIRELISEIPAELVNSEKSTQEIVRIATETLNLGLRPHLTRWQARFRNWYAANSEELKNIEPQELQKKYPQYNELAKDLTKINCELIEYSKELKKIIDS